MNTQYLHPNARILFLNLVLSMLDKPYNVLKRFRRFTIL